MVLYHHGLFSPIPCIRTGATLSVYNTMVSSHQLYSWDHGPLYAYATWCCIDRYNGHWFHVWDWWEETMVLDRQIEWSLVSCMVWDWWEEIMMHGFFSPTLFMRPWTTLCLCNTMVSSYQSHTWEQGPLYLSIQHHGLFSSILFMRPGTTLCLYNTMVRPWCCIER
jgi:hypothetical protein